MAEVRWIPSMLNQARDTELAETGRAEQLYRKFRAILNKLTPQKFQSLAEQALKLEINTEERLRGCIDMIYEKVCLSFSSIRAFFNQYIF